MSISGTRSRSIKLIHIGRSKLQLDEDTYRQMLVNLTGADSCSKLSQADLDKVLKHLQDRGFVITAARSFPGRPKNTDRHPQLTKIEAQLADLKLPWAYARSIAKRQCGKVLEFCNPPEWAAVISALAVRQAKEGKGEHR